MSIICKYCGELNCYGEHVCKSEIVALKLWISELEQENEQKSQEIGILEHDIKSLSAELDKKWSEDKKQQEINKLGDDKFELLKQVTRQRQENERLKRQQDCRSGTEECDLFHEEGFPCYRHLHFDYEKIGKENKQLKADLDYYRSWLRNTTNKKARKA